MSKILKISKTRHDETEQISSGGVVFRTDRGTTEVVIILTNPERRWQLPKGMIDPGETEEQTAIREVREETGVNAISIGHLGKTEYRFSAIRKGKKRDFHKFVHWFAMLYESGDVKEHDDEVFEARWVNINQAFEMLEFESEREIVRKALTKITENQTDS